MSNERPLQILVQTAFLGDLILSIGLLKAMRRLHPERRIGLVCREKLGSFFLRLGLVDELFEIRKGDASSYRDAVAKIRASKPVAVYSAHTSVRTALFVRSLRASATVGFHKTWNAWAYRRRVKRKKTLPDVLRQMSLLAPEDATLQTRLEDYERGQSAYRRDDNGKLSEVPSWASISLRPNLMARGQEWADLRQRLNLPTDKNLVAIFPGSVWATKRWTPEGFVETGKRLAEKGAQIVMMGAGNEVALAEDLAKKIPNAISCAGKTDLFESALILAHANLMIGNDSASVHLAAVAETPTVAVFGPTVLEQGFRPWSNNATIVDRKDLACRPCGPHGHNKCPRGTHECMTDISPEEVVTAGSRSLFGTQSVTGK